MIFLRAKPLRGPLEGAGPENCKLQIANCNLLRSLQLQGPKQLRFSGPAPSNGPSNGFSLQKNHNGKLNKKYRFIGNFMQMRTEWLFQGPHPPPPTLPTPNPPTLGGWGGCGQLTHQYSSDSWREI